MCAERTKSVPNCIPQESLCYNEKESIASFDHRIASIGENVFEAPAYSEHSKLHSQRNHKKQKLTPKCMALQFRDPAKVEGGPFHQTRVHSTAERKFQSNADCRGMQSRSRCSVLCADKFDQKNYSKEWMNKEGFFFMSV
jgi:hypothetical protein